MNEATKAKITNMQLSGEDGNIRLEISGDIQVKEIQSALEKSTVIKSK